MERAGLDFDAILAALTTAPAILFGFEGQTGRIEPGLGFPPHDSTIRRAAQVSGQGCSAGGWLAGISVIASAIVFGPSWCSQLTRGLNWAKTPAGFSSKSHMWSS